MVTATNLLAKKLEWPLPDIEKPNRIIYIAGPFRAKTQWGIINNVRKAEEASLRLWKLGYVVICPHTMTQNFQHECPDEVWLDGCVELLKRSDAIFMLEGWESSEGSREELRIARELGLTVIGDKNAKISE